MKRRDKKWFNLFARLPRRTHRRSDGPVVIDPDKAERIIVKGKP